jgi:hypothetical protein
MNISKYRDLICSLDTQIAELSKGFCRSNTYGYCNNKAKLLRLIRTKELLQNSFNLQELNNTYYSCTTEQGSDIQVVKKFNKLVGNKAQLVVKTITKTLNTTREFSFELPAIPHTGGFYIYGLWINCNLETLDDVNKVLAILENLQYLGFFDFSYDALTNTITSSTSYVYEETFSYEYVYFDVLKTLECVNYKQVVKLIENVS